jgi:hypothetical protein
MTTAPFPILLDALQLVELEVLSAVAVISDIGPCRPVEVNKRFGRTYEGGPKSNRNRPVAHACFLVTSCAAR